MADDAPPQELNENRQKALQEELRELLDVVGPAQLVELLMERSFHLRATDIHLDPFEQGLRIRLRVDGMMHDVLSVPPDLAPPMISRAKLLAGMNITEKRFSQDGHISRTITNQHRDVRVGSGPTLFGERLVLRLMSDSASLRRLEDLGPEPDQLEVLKRCVSRPHGLIVVAGPVGSGKTATIYSCLELANDPSKSVLTIEDPVERRIPGVTQIQIDGKIGFGFPEALRGVMRQDPNVMLIGEIRDGETAQIAARAARTGILVLSTLHANEAAGSFDVFRDFGVPAMFVADSITAVVSQRLIRKVCANCCVFSPATPAERRFLEAECAVPDDLQLAQGTGCNECFQTGFAGRTGIFEIIAVDDDLRQALLDGAPRAEIVRLARSKGMSSLQAAAARKVVNGTTALQEMHRLLLTEPPR